LAIPVVNDVTKQVGIYDLETALYLGGFERKGLLALPIRAEDVDGLIDKINGDDRLGLGTYSGDATYL
jgi:hypothetical protein